MKQILKEYIREVDENGFSLLELVVAVGILLTLSVGGMIAYVGVTKNAREAAVAAAASEVLTAAVAYDLDNEADTEPTDAETEWNETSKKDASGNAQIVVSVDDSVANCMKVTATHDKGESATRQTGTGCVVDGESDGGNGGSTTPGGDDDENPGNGGNGGSTDPVGDDNGSGNPGDDQNALVCADAPAREVAERLMNKSSGSYEIQGDSVVIRNSGIEDVANAYREAFNESVQVLEEMVSGDGVYGQIANEFRANAQSGMAGISISPGIANVETDLASASTSFLARAHTDGTGIATINLQDGTVSINLSIACEAAGDGDIRAVANGAIQEAFAQVASSGESSFRTALLDSEIEIVNPSTVTTLGMTTNVNAIVSGTLGEFSDGKSGYGIKGRLLGVISLDGYLSATRPLVQQFVQEPAEAASGGVAEEVQQTFDSRTNGVFDRIVIL